MAFYDLFQKLVLAKQVRFEKGNVALLNQRVVITPVEQVISVTELLLDDNSLIGKLYKNEVMSFSEGFAEAVHKMYGLEDRNLTKWLVDLSNICGWGEHKLVRFDIKKKEGVLRFKGSPVAMYFKGKTKIPVDHVWRGLTAAGARKIFGEDIDFIETKCEALGDKTCEFIFKPRKSLTSEEKAKFGYQIGLE
jgi:predicted hydrocarbon binding protein